LILVHIDCGRFSLADFYIRRVRRIFPALFLVVAATALAGRAVLTLLDLKLLGESTFATATFSSRVRRAQASVLTMFEPSDGVHVIWPHQELCDVAYCNVELSDSPLYADDDHLTFLGAHLVSRRFDSVFER
jgi:SGNH domain (fused to AT3 domains)